MAREVRTAISWREITKTGFAYGGGLTVGNIISLLLLSVLSPRPYSFLGEDARQIIGLVLVSFVFGLGGALGGFIGGRTLPVTGERKGKRSLAWRSAISFSIAYGIFLLLIVLGLSVLGMRAAAFVPVGPFMQVYSVVGIIMGALISLLLGLSSVGWRRTGLVLIAGIVGFGLGGAALGAGIWAHIESTQPGDLYTGNYILLLIGLYAFGLLGGLALGFVYSRFALEESRQKSVPQRTWVRFVLFGLLGLLVLWLLIRLRPLPSFAADMMAPRAALQTETIAADSVGTNWQESLPLAPTIKEAATLDLTSGELDITALVWSEESSSHADVYLKAGRSDRREETSWGPSINVSNSAADSHDPSTSIARAGELYVSWLEGYPGDAYYSLCSSGSCAVPLNLTDSTISCPSGSVGSDTPSLAVAAGPDGTAMVVWSDLRGGLQYRILPDGPMGCVPTPKGVSVGGFSLFKRPSAGFSLAFDNMIDSIWLTKYTGTGWDPAAVKLSSGVQPDMFVARNGLEYLTWCSEDGGVKFWSEGQTEMLSRLSCQGKPSIAVDGADRIHVVWQSNQVEDVLGMTRQHVVLYEAVGDGQSWSEPAIISTLGEPSDFEIVSDTSGRVHLAWTGSNPAVHYALQRPYGCDPRTLLSVEAELYKVASLGGYRPENEVIPFCQNHFESLIFTPTTNPSFSSEEPTLNGAYDDYAELMQTANYEVLFTTMVFAEDVYQESPGAVLAEGIVDLYEKVRANPHNYPRGMLVRILLGNSPAPTFELLELDGALWYVLEDLQKAGLKKMIDPELGWWVEVGNFASHWPHSHVKTMIVDGKTVVASGFNHEYKPLSKDHPSGLGLGDVDTGLVLTGPVAQHSRRIFDQLWTGAILRHCPDLNVSESAMRLNCIDSRGVPDHVPEVLRYSTTNDEVVAFSMFRDRAYDEADQQMLAAFRAADDNIDLAHAMFSMELICNLNLFFEVCDFGQAQPYMKALMDAAENGAKLRIVVTPYPSQHFENIIAIKIFNEEAARRGLADRVEFRMLDDLLHSKSALIDGEFLIVGSQNLHWSAFGVDKGLSEYNLGVRDPDAAEQYRSFFEHLWERATVPFQNP